MSATQDIRQLTRRTIIDMAMRRQRPGSGSTLLRTDPEDLESLIQLGKLEMERRKD